jgi:hypothetical protein
LRHFVSQYKVKLSPGGEGSEGGAEGDGLKSMEDTRQKERRKEV